jgi:hypothetical protein
METPPFFPEAAGFAPWSPRDACEFSVRGAVNQPMPIPMARVNTSATMCATPKEPIKPFFVSFIEWAHRPTPGGVQAENKKNVMPGEFEMSFASLLSQIPESPAFSFAKCDSGALQNQRDDTNSTNQHEFFRRTATIQVLSGSTLPKVFNHGFFDLSAVSF